MTHGERSIPLHIPNHYPTVWFDIIRSLEILSSTHLSDLERPPSPASNRDGIGLVVNYIKSTSTRLNGESTDSYWSDRIRLTTYTDPSAGEPDLESQVNCEDLVDIELNKFKLVQFGGSEQNH